MRTKDILGFVRKVEIVKRLRLAEKADGERLAEGAGPRM